MDVAVSLEMQRRTSRTFLLGPVLLLGACLQSDDAPDVEDSNDPDTTTINATGSIITATSATRSAVEDAVNRANEGDTIVVPAGTASWTRKLVITKGITLKGQSMTYRTGDTWRNQAYATDRTIIKDDTPLGGQDDGLIAFNIQPGQRGRVTGFTFAAGQRTTDSTKGAIIINTSGATFNNAVRVDHNHFAGVHRLNIQPLGWALGLADHNLCEGHMVMAVNGEAREWDAGANGDGSWADYPYLGSNKFFFFEDNTVRPLAGETYGGHFDGMFGFRIVIRHNYIRDAYWGNHGTESGRGRGARMLVAYNNIVEFTVPKQAQQIRSGVAVNHDNLFIGAGPTNHDINPLAIYRENYRAQLWGFAHGANPWDLNAPNRPFDHGTVRVDNTMGRGQITITDGTKNWQPGVWRGYSIRNTTPGQPYSDKGASIIDNDATSITIGNNHLEDNHLDWIWFYAGNSYEINKVTQALDQPGTGRGDLITGTDPINTRTGTKAWPRPQREPCLSWNNVVQQTGEVLGYQAAGVTSVRATRDFLNLGAGVPANTVPAAAQQAYPASVNGGTAYTHEYTYPHPMNL